jgi:hypothetical protein
MKKLIFVLLLNAYLFSCTGQGCISHNSNCYGQRCTANMGSCYGLLCVAYGGSCYGDFCRAYGGNSYGRGCINRFRYRGHNCNSLPQSIIDQYPGVVFTLEQSKSNLENQLATTSDNLTKIRLNFQLLWLQNLMDPNAILSHLTTTLNTIKTLIPTPAPANLVSLSESVNHVLQRILRPHPDPERQLSQEDLRLISQQLIIRSDAIR